MLECDVGQPPSRQGLSLLEFGNERGSGFTGPTHEILLQYYLGEPFDGWSLRGKYLVSDANTAVAGDPAFDVQSPTTTPTPFDLAAYPLHPSPDSFVQYRSADAFWRRAPLRVRSFQEADQHETLLFARDPNEVFDAMAALRPFASATVPHSISDLLRDNFTASTSPDVATLSYPPEANWNTSIQMPGPAPIHAYYSTVDFWQPSATPSGPGAAPTGTGSVKASMVVDHGLCSQLIRYSDILPAIPTQFMSAIEQQLANGMDASEPINLERSDIVSFLRMPDERDSQPGGGFFFGFDAFFSKIKDLGFPLGSVAASAELWNGYQFVLLDGRLTVDPLRDDSSAGALVNYLPDLGPAIGAAFEEQLDGALLESLTTPLRPADVPTTIAGNVWHEADQRQKFAGLPFEGAPCTPDPLFGEKLKVVNDPTKQGQCQNLFKNMRNHLQDTLQAGHFGSFVGVPATAFGQLWNDTALKSSDGVFYDDFRCAPPTDNGNPECEYILPADRINTLPDGVELVFVSGDKEYATPSFLLWVILGDAPGVAPDDGKPWVQKLCDPPRPAAPAGNGFSPDTFLPRRRPFFHSTDDNRTISATNCQQVSVNPDAFHCDVVVQ